MMEKKLLVDEDFVVSLTAEGVVDRVMIQMLTSYLLRSFPSGQRGPWLDGLLKDFQQKSIGLPAVKTESQAVLLSDIAIQVRERGAALVGVLRQQVADDEKWEAAHRTAVEPAEGN